MSIVNRRGNGPEGFNTTTHQAQQPDIKTFQGRPVIAQQFGRCQHCKCDLTSLLVGPATSRRWINTATFGPLDVEHNCLVKP